MTVRMAQIILLVLCSCFLMLASQSAFTNALSEQTRTELHNGIDSNFNRLKRQATTPHIFPIRKDKDGTIITLNTGEPATYLFSDGAPTGILLDSQSGDVNRQENHDWGQQSTLLFKVNITQGGQTYVQDVRIILLDREHSENIFVNEPDPIWVRIPVWIRPGSVIFTLHSKDKNDFSVDVKYKLESGGEGMFAVDEKNGEISIVGRQEFPLGQIFPLAVSAIPTGVIEGRTRTPVQVVTVQVDDVKPQFFTKDRYIVEMSEYKTIGESVHDMRSHSFQELELEYSLEAREEDSRNSFRIDSATGMITLRKKLKHITDRRTYNVVVTVSEKISRLTSQVEVRIELKGENLNAPYFPAVVYPKLDFSETSSVGKEVMKVTAIDLDEGINGHLTFSLDSSYFEVENVDDKTASIKVNRSLDYDWQKDHMYSVILTARDKGEPSRSGSTTVQVFMKDENDQAPVFVPEEQVIIVKDKTQNKVIHVVQAYDPEGQQLTFNLRDDFSNLFSIDRTTGQITINELSKDRFTKDLVVEASDGFLTAVGKVQVQFTGVNTPPLFTKCTDYDRDSSVLEGDLPDTRLFTFSATDNDPSDNPDGQLSYSTVVVSGVNKDLFVVKPNNDPGQTADLYTGPQTIFDRENPPKGSVVTDDEVKISMTLQVKDNGDPALSATCFFFIKIIDVNDNPPAFDRSDYDTVISTQTSSNTKVIRVMAHDYDAGDNAKLVYTLSQTCSQCFRIDGSSGWIYRSTGNIPNAVTEVTLDVTATDSATIITDRLSTTVTVTIRLTDKTSDLPPRWNGNIEEIIIPENTERNTKLNFPLDVTSYKDGEKVFFHLNRGARESENYNGDFVMDKENDILVDKIDHEQTREYTLRLTVSYESDSELYTDYHLTVKINDVNDESPYFVGLDETGKYPATVSVETGKNDQITKVTAIDKDGSNYNKVTYSFEDDCTGCDKFLIHPETGVITANADEYIREEQSVYTLQVQASDNSNAVGKDAPNTTPQIVNVDVIGSTDSPPEFRISEITKSFTVDEGSSFDTNVGTVVAHDPDPAHNTPQYHIMSINSTSPRERWGFGVDILTGRIFVMSPVLRYDEERHKYPLELEYRCFDGAVESFVKLTITMRKINLNPPFFLSEKYTVNDVTESSQTPDSLLQVKVAEDEDVTYTLAGKLHVDNPGTFTIDSEGRVTLLKSLDREPPAGHPTWVVNVVATDKPSGSLKSKKGYSLLEVAVQDENDSPPGLDSCCLTGSVKENSREGTLVTKLTVTDRDATAIAECQMVPEDDNEHAALFQISTDCSITTTATLDREARDRYHIMVEVVDPERDTVKSPTYTIWITVDDDNDHTPTFDPDYEFDMDEGLEVGSVVTYLEATDPDLDELIYTVNGKDGDYFYADSVLVAKSGAIKINKKIDYDSQKQDNLEFEVSVTDGSSTVSTTVKIRVNDVNDNVPEFTEPVKKISQPENKQALDESVQFTATDGDSGDNGKVKYFIDYRNSDRDRHFVIDESTGKVSLRRSLDYEKSHSMSVMILAIDEGEPAMTGTATLQVSVTDMNDNLPTLERADYNFQVGEGSRDEVFEFGVADADSDDSNVRIEDNCNTVAQAGICSDFTFEEKKVNGKVRGTLKANRDKFTRDNGEPKKILYPVKLVNSPSEAREVDIEITVKSYDDNSQSDGEKSIVVYNYRRELNTSVIGSVYVQDLDDWDHGSKVFTLAGDHNDFLLGEGDEHGHLKMMRGTPQGEHVLSVDVEDGRNTVTSTITVNVHYLEEETMRTAGSVRFSGSTARGFLEKGEADTESNIDVFRRQLSQMLDTSEENVDIFTVKDVDKPNPLVASVDQIDVLFAAHGSPWYRKSRLNGQLWLNREQVEVATGLDMVMSPVDLCRGECWGGCHTVFSATPQPLIVDANYTTLVGASVDIQAICECPSASFTYDTVDCQPDTCMNNGTCVEDWVGYHCICEEGFEGPRCQATKLSLDNGLAWVETLETCEDGKTSLEFITNKATALLLYNGPMYSSDPDDFLALQLKDGFPVLSVNLGEGLLTLEIDGKNRENEEVVRSLNDGKWHTIEIFKKYKTYRMVIDHCTDSKVNVNESIAYSEADRSSCEIEGEVQGEDFLLSVFTPLELGGRSSTNSKNEQITTEKFKGCIKNLWHNGMLYDLAVTERGHYEGSVDEGCFDERGCSLCENGTCVGSFTAAQDSGSCICHPGFTGSTCNREVDWRDFNSDQSYMEWDMLNLGQNDARNNTFMTELQISFRTRDINGVLFSIQSFSTLERLKLTIDDSYLWFTYDLGAGDQSLSLAGVNVSDGRIHTAKIGRYGNQVVLQVDGGEGAHYVESWPQPLHRLIAFSMAFSAAEISYKNRYHTQPDVDRSTVLIHTCVRDIRVTSEPFPMDIGEESEVAELVKQHGIDEKCEDDGCVGVSCPDGTNCTNYWRMPYCICPDFFHPEPVNGVCVPITDCSLNPCVNGDCVVINGNWRCNCLPEYMGAHCDRPLASSSSAELADSSIIIIVLAIIILLILIMLFIAYTYARRKHAYIMNVDSNDGIRENIMHYEEEGAGEEDMHNYDLSRLQKPVDIMTDAPYRGGGDPRRPPYQMELPRKAPDAMSAPRPFRLPGDYPQVGDYIDDRLHDTDDDPSAPPYDSVREYDYEGAGSQASDLSSLCTSSSGDQDYDYLKDWGPPFRKLADMYGAGEGDDSSSV